MPKATKGKSSASSGTRKKNAAKAAKKDKEESNSNSKDENQQTTDPSATTTPKPKPKAANQPSQRGEKKSKKERKEALAKAKKKSYVPPPKPPQPPPDPLDSMGLASRLQPDLVVLLRKLGKKDVVTRERALEGLKAWIDGKDEEGQIVEDWIIEQRRFDLLVMLPSWLHLFPRLSISPTRKLRLLTSQILSSLLSFPEIRKELLFSPQHQEALLGPWSILTWDNDKLVSKTCKDLWDSSWSSSSSNLDGSTISKSDQVPADASSSDEASNSKLKLNSETLEILLNHLNNVLLSQSPSHFLSLTFSSQAPISLSDQVRGGDSTPTGRDAKNRDELNLEEGREDTDGRLKSGSLGCLNWVLSVISSTPNPSSSLLPENLVDLLKNPKIYSSLTTSSTNSIPSLKIKTFQLLSTLNSSKNLTETENFFEKEILEMVSPEALISLWKEKDLTVIRSGIDSFLPILRKNPQVWECQLNEKKTQRQNEEEEEDDDDDDDDDDDSESDSEEDREDEEEERTKVAVKTESDQTYYPSFEEFKLFLKRGLSPAPQLSYPTILLFLTTLPTAVLNFDYQSSNQLLESIYSPFGNRELDSDNRGDVNSFLFSLFECFSWLSRRILKEGKEENQDGIRLIESGFFRIWKDLVVGSSFSFEELQASKDDENQNEEEKESIKDQINRRNRFYNSLSNPKISSEFGSTFKKIFNSMSSDTGLFQRFLQFMKTSLENNIQDSDKSRKEIEKSITRTIGIFENLISIKVEEKNLTPPLNNQSVKQIEDLIQGLMNDSIKSLSKISPELQQRNLILISSLINSRIFSSGFKLSTESRDSLTLLSEEILPKMISDGEQDGSNNAKLIGSIMKLLNDSVTEESVNGEKNGSGIEVWKKALEGSISLKDENQRIGNILQILEAEESSRRNQPKIDENHDEDEEDENSKPLDEIAISLTSEFCSSHQNHPQLETLIQKLLLSSDEEGQRFFALSKEKANEILFLLCSKISGIHSNFISKFSSIKSNSKFKSRSKSENSTKYSDQDSKDYLSSVSVLRVLNSWIEKDSSRKLEFLRNNELFSEIPTFIFELALLRSSRSEAQSNSALTEVQNNALKLWTTMLQAEGQEVELLDLSNESLRSRLRECEIPLEVIIRASKESNSKESDSFSHRVKLLPNVEEFEKLAIEVASVEPDSTLSILDPLIPSAPSSTSKPSKKFKFDSQGYSTFSRFSLLLSKAIENDTRFSKSISNWSIPLLLLFSLSIEDKLSNENQSSNHLFNQNCNLLELKYHFKTIIQNLTSLISSLCNNLDDDWHVETVAILQREKGDRSNNLSTNTTNLDPLRFSLLTIYRLSKSNSSQDIQFSRIFKKFLCGILSFSSITSVDGERWLKLGQSLMTSFPTLASSIFYSVKSLASSTPFYDRLRNDLASRLAGIPSSKANDEGLKLLNLLLSSAPNLETGEIPLIPQQRSIFLFQTFGKWFASDEDFSDELNSKLIQLFIHLLPIVQDLQGSHLDLIFDLLENNLEISEIADKDSWGLIFDGLRLLDQIRDLSSRNKSLNSIWKERKVPILVKVHDLFLELSPSSEDLIGQKSSSSVRKSTCLPREVIGDLLVDLVREVPSDTFSNQKDQETLIRLMAGTSGIASSQKDQVEEISKEMQVVAYKLLNACISDKVRELVLEVAVGKSKQEEESEREIENDQNQEPIESKLDLTLPSSLLEVVSASVNSSTAQFLLEDQSLLQDSDDEDEEEDGTISELETAQEGRKAVFGLLLSWMAIFDHFEDASLQIRSSYLAQIEKSELVEGLALTVFNLLNGTGGRNSSNSFEAGKWGIEEIGLDDLDTSSGLALQALASHVYLRSLTHFPTLIRSWWFSLKDRQLSMSVSNFTTKHCSPSISSRELSHLRQEDSLSKLQDEAMTIKFQGSNEVVATYVVDEHPIEMGIKIPNDFPLHAIEIRDPADAGKRVGISESQWRAWILATQQLITSKNGLILDALMLFKKNAEAKFAGFEGAECAICYSIISPTDRSLPVKPCPTCKNKFHASCLFKWVTTSGSSTCPLCRSVI